MERLVDVFGKQRKCELQNTVNTSRPRLRLPLLSVLPRQWGVWGAALQTRSRCGVMVGVPTGGGVPLCRARGLRCHCSDSPSEAQSRPVRLSPCAWGRSGRAGFPTACGGAARGCAPLRRQPLSPGLGQPPAAPQEPLPSLGSSPPPGSRLEQGPRSLLRDVSAATTSSLHPHRGTLPFPPVSSFLLVSGEPLHWPVGTDWSWCLSWCLKTHDPTPCRAAVRFCGSQWLSPNCGHGLVVRDPDEGGRDRARWWESGAGGERDSQMSLEKIFSKQNHFKAVLF